MKKHEIEKTVDNNFKNIEKSFHKILSHFNNDDIQQFRTEIKKLRAFFHLLDMEAGGDTHFKITSKMKTFYGYTGIIRNLHLLLETINSHFEYSTDKDLMAFISKLEKEINYWEKNTKEFVSEHKNFEVDEENLLARLPERLRRRSIKKFVSYLGYEIQTFLTRCDDEKLNSTRKLLEDLFYNWEHVKPFADILPEGLRKEDEVQFLFNSLSGFRDMSAENTILDTYYNDSESDEEKVILATIIQFCKSQKEELKSVICTKLELIPVQPIVRRAFSL
jgi:hypothetical protein